MTEETFIDTDEFNPIEDSDTSAVLEGLEKINKEIQDKKSKKKDSKKEEKVEEEPESKYPPAELLAIFDSLIFQGEYEETFKGRQMSLTLRTRSGDDAINISRAIDKFEGKTFMTVQTYSNILTLAHSLVAYNGKTFGPKDTAPKYKFLLTLPDAVLAMLFEKLQVFDEKIGLAIKEGRKNF